MTSDGGHEADDEADEDVQSPGDDGATTDDDSERCQDCGHRRPLEISYTIEDLDTLDQRQRQLRQSQSSGGLEVSSDGRRCRSFLSPDDALRDLRKHASQGAEIRWELHSSRSDVGQATTSTATTCGCHRSQSTLTPRSHPQRGDLRKHHSAEKDKWSLKPESEHDLRKHLSDDCRMAGSSREPRWTEHLQVPELHANPRQRCTCAKRLGPVSLSPSPSDETPEDSRRPSLRASRSLSPEDLPLLQKRPSATDSRSLTPVPQSEQSQQARTPSPQPQTQPTNSKASKKDKARLAEERKAMRSKWAVKPHFSLPSEPKGHKLWSDKDPKSKSLKERPKYSVRRSLSPDPDPRQVYRLDNRLVRKLISPEVSLVDAKWAPYEGHSPLPNVGMRRRDTKKVVHEIQWQPYESPIHIGKSVNVAPPAPRRQESSEGPLAYSTLEKQVSIYGAEDPPKPGDEFSSVTPTHLPPPIATPQHGLSSGTDDDDEAFRMRMLNQVSAFPMYQGAWREETPPPSPPAPDLSTPVWAPKPPTPPPVRKQQSVRAVTPSPPPEKRSTFKLRSTSSKKKAAMRAKSQESTRQDKRRSTVKHSTRRGDPRIDDPDNYQQQQQQQQQQNQRRRPQLLRSKALLLEAPTMEASKRSLSEEVRPKRRGTESSVKRGLYFRAKSEDAARYNPWLSGDEENDDYDGYDDLEAELREYVTTV